MCCPTRAACTAKKEIAMSTTTLNLQANTAAPLAAVDTGWLATLARLVGHRPALPQVIREAAAARALARDWAQSDPRVAAELMVAADRHEAEFDN
jgi:hypothetical protein